VNQDISLQRLLDRLVAARAAFHNAKSEQHSYVAAGGKDPKILHDLKIPIELTVLEICFIEAQVVNLRRATQYA
jgi:hypothetical protein